MITIAWYLPLYVTLFAIFVNELFRCWTRARSHLIVESESSPDVHREMLSDAVTPLVQKELTQLMSSAIHERTIISLNLIGATGYNVVKDNDMKLFAETCIERVLGGDTCSRQDLNVDVDQVFVSSDIHDILVGCKDRPGTLLTDPYYPDNYLLRPLLIKPHGQLNLDHCRDPWSCEALKLLAPGPDGTGLGEEVSVPRNKIVGMTNYLPEEVRFGHMKTQDFIEVCGTSATLLQIPSWQRLSEGRIVSLMTNAKENNIVFPIHNDLATEFPVIPKELGGGVFKWNGLQWDSDRVIAHEPLVRGDLPIEWLPYATFPIMAFIFYLAIWRSWAKSIDPWLCGLLAAGIATFYDALANHVVIQSYIYPLLWYADVVVIKSSSLLQSLVKVVLQEFLFELLSHIQRHPPLSGSGFMMAYLPPPLQKQPRKRFAKKKTPSISLHVSPTPTQRPNNATGSGSMDGVLIEQKPVRIVRVDATVDAVVSQVDASVEAIEQVVPKVDVSVTAHPKSLNVAVTALPQSFEVSINNVVELTNAFANTETPPHDYYHSQSLPAVLPVGIGDFCSDASSPEIPYSATSLFALPPCHVIGDVPSDIPPASPLYSEQDISGANDLSSPSRVPTREVPAQYYPMTTTMPPPLPFWPIPNTDSFHPLMTYPPHFIFPMTPPVSRQNQRWSQESNLSTPQSLSSVDSKVDDVPIRHIYPTRMAETNNMYLTRNNSPFAAMRANTMPLLHNEELPMRYSAPSTPFYDHYQDSPVSAYQPPFPPHMVQGSQQDINNYWSNQYPPTNHHYRPNASESGSIPLSQSIHESYNYSLIRNDSPPLNCDDPSTSPISDNRS